VSVSSTGSACTCNTGTGVTVTGVTVTILFKKKERTNKTITRKRYVGLRILYDDNIMFLVIVLFIVILFYPKKESFLDQKSVNKLQSDFEDIFVKSNESIREERDSYLKLYNALIKLK
jgi:hypothetical protein